MQPEFIFKVICCGDFFVGKTSLIKKAVYDEFSNTYKATLGLDFALKVLEYPQMNIRMQIWDIGGQERQKHMHRVFFRDAVGAIVVYDLTNEASFHSAKEWKKEIDRSVFLDEETRMPIPTILLGNKSDVPHQEFIKKEEVADFCKEHGFISYMQVSAKTGRNIDAALRELADVVMETCKDMIEEDENDPAEDAIILSPDQDMQSGKVDKKGCCT